MPRPSRFSPEVRERAIRMVRDHAQAYPSQWRAEEQQRLKLLKRENRERRRLPHRAPAAARRRRLRSVFRRSDRSPLKSKVVLRLPTLSPRARLPPWIAALPARLGIWQYPPLRIGSRRAVSTWLTLPERPARVAQPSVPQA